ncbi:MAG TPA: UDP-N-acetylmuramoyl-tripeptide--D-alanyl-D-alanine ligase [Flavobacteriaceae bacterium]|nr:UDP-N-acetylmuramoyl-tripeptide--D-alanyl-D-alanine ligase [Flavobacteriaceae bacterium]
MEISKIHELFLKGKGVSTDTRKIEKGTIFFALKGENFNGNKFALQAIEKGAAIVIADEIFEVHEKIVQVENVLETLQELATFHRNYLKTPIIALTGSNGKTTTKELVNAVLSKKFNTTATQGNLNNHIGVPLTLLSMSENTQIGIVEMGANHPKEIANLCEIALPDYGYITNFGKAHLEGFGGIVGVIKSKSELYDFLKNNNKTIFVNSDDELQIKQSKGAETYQIGENKGADCQVKFLNADPFVEMSFDELTIKSKLIGKYNAKNIAAAIGIGQYFEVLPKKIVEAIEAYIPQNNRSQIIEQNGNKIIMDAYNANPTSMLAALESFDSLPGKNKVLILGDMFELGENSLAEHQAIVDQIESLDFDIVYLCGKDFHRTQSGSIKIQHFENFEELKNELEKTKFSAVSILIKGSRGMALERILKSL